MPIQDIVEEHRLYLPSIGLFSAVAVYVASNIRMHAYNLRAVSVVILAILAVLTFSRNAVWATEYSLWRDVSIKSPHSARPHSFIAKSYYAEGRYSDAVSELERVLEIDPAYDQIEDVYNNLGLAYMGLGRLNAAAASFRSAINAAPGLVEAYSGLGQVLFDLGRYDEAADVLERGAKVNPGFEPVIMRLG